MRGGIAICPDYFEEHKCNTYNWQACCVSQWMWIAARFFIIKTNYKEKRSGAAAFLPGRTTEGACAKVRD